MPVPDLERFLEAQARVYPQVLAQLREGTKRSHWMWFIFPQLLGLGHSATAQRYAIVDRAHAQAYLAHPVLGARLRECVQWLNGHTGLTAERIFGYPDYLKLHSCLTLFATVAPDELSFDEALRKYYGGLPDAATLELLRS
jgi:uncharacterized protein (DUF1810 family)